MSFKEGTRADMAKVFLDADEFGEAVTVYPEGKGKLGGRVILAEVQRGRPAPMGVGDTDPLELSAEVEISRDPVLGLLQVLEHQTEFDMALVEGGPVITCRVVEILGQGHESWRLRVVK